MSNSLLQEMEADQTTVSAVEAVDQSGLKSIAGIARAVRDQEDLVQRLESDLKAAKKDLLKLTDEDLPAMLLELGLSSFELDDGSKVTVRPTYGAHIKADNKETAFDWLRAHEYGDLIKNTVSCQFGRGEDHEAVEFMEYAQKLGYAAEQKTDVHPSTLKAWVKERVQNGDEFPMELFGAFVGQRATINRSK
jgi:hypothetical protein